MKRVMIVCQRCGHKHTRYEYKGAHIFRLYPPCQLRKSTWLVSYSLKLADGVADSARGTVKECQELVDSWQLA